MGYTVNHWILVSGTDFTDRGARPEGIFERGSPRPVAWARELATQIFPPEQVSHVLLGAINHQDHLSIAPDSSNEGWGLSNAHDCLRAMFINSLIVGRVRHGHILTWTIFGLGEDGTQPTISEYHDSLFYALCEGEPVLSTRITNPVTVSEALNALDLIVFGATAERMKQRVRDITADTFGTQQTRARHLVAAEAMVLAKLLKLDDKYGAIGSPDQLPTQHSAPGAATKLPSYAAAFYTELLAAAQDGFPGVHPSVE